MFPCDALPAKPKAKHHKAMPYADLPEFMVKLVGRDSVSARALEFAVLTAAGTDEVIGAKWSEIDPPARLQPLDRAREPPRDPGPVLQGGFLS